MQTSLKNDSEYQIISFTWPKGYQSDGLHAGLRKVKNDMGWIYSSTPAKAAGTYTTNQFQAAPTTLTKNTINKNHTLQAIIMNSAVANSCTGKLGEKNAEITQNLVADKLNIDSNLVGVASTGLIGDQLPMDIIKKGIDQLQLTNNTEVTNAVLTTDKHTKTISTQVIVDGKVVTISGFCKGSGMIHPMMATMLGFIMTDVQIKDGLLQELLSTQVDSTFNQITVDGDTSTNDMVVTMANGQANNTELTKNSEDYDSFVSAFHKVLSTLAQDIAQDGEGSTKLVEVNVQNAATHDDGQKVAKAIVGSNLVKSAIFGEDANWGRIVAAIGQTNATVDIEHTSIWLNSLPLVVNSQAGDYDENEMKQALSNNKITILVDLNSGNSIGQAWGCDLTYNYVRINATYKS